MTRRAINFVVLGFMLSACSTSVNDGALRGFSGVWLYEFEGSTFIEGATKVPKKPPAYGEAAWLDYHPDQLHANQDVEMSEKDRYDQGRGCYLTYPYLVTFNGRRVTKPHGSGHMGLWPAEVTVDRMISSKPLGRPFCYGS